MPAEAIFTIPVREARCVACRLVFQTRGSHTHCKRCEEDQRKAKEHENVIASLNYFASTIPRWPWSRFGNPLFAARTAHAPAIVGAAASWTLGNLILSGESGLGKTASAVAMAHRLYDSALPMKPLDPPVRLAAGALFATANDIAKVRSGRCSSGRTSLLEACEDATVLFLDEAGFEPRSSRVRIFAIVDARYRRCLPTIVTTGRNLNGLRERYGDACLRRLLDAGEFVSDLPRSAHQ